MRLIRLWPENSHFDFMRLRRYSFPLSALISVATAIVLMTVGLNFGIDFKGGTLMEIQAKSGQANVAQIRQTAESFGFGDVEVQEFGGTGEVSLRFPIQSGGEAAQTAVVQKARDTFGNDYDFRRVETVGPRVSGELVQSGTIGIVLSVIAVLFYLWFRFERELAVASIIGTLHDIVLTIGFFVITRHEFNMTSIAAILTIVGYSLNETVVVFDRTRELMRRYKAMPAEELLNLSINTTMSRTIMTATTTALSLLALVLFGGQAIQGFAQVMLYGVVICTYSAICISSPMLIYIGLRGSETVKVPEGRAAAAE
ncbi:protein translocase subunit SecF [Microvirga terrae]|uniref:Protein-export membrane protein SecF n=1 Tax=Microvirga terrae TaxID=2740529 RepID=A0ABY5RPC8_9HYPH|nr:MULTISPECIES: protein translocase subunit SecF [Microvirga]MBQ0823129.1 protein translocase subunit SecF [Microvirga sp. HBU67558]UVF17859.1 protein translocase subunit SecF [Microvirga terrae]